MTIGQTVADKRRFFDFLEMAAVRHFKFVMHVFEPPTKRIWCLLNCCAEFGWNWLCSFEDMLVSTLCELGLKMPIHAPFGVFQVIWEIFAALSLW